MSPPILAFHMNDRTHHTSTSRARGSPIHRLRLLTVRQAIHDSCRAGAFSIGGEDPALSDFLKDPAIISLADGSSTTDQKSPLQALI